MAIYKGSSSIKNVQVGSSSIKQIYKGSTLIWERSGISLSQSAGTGTNPLSVNGGQCTISINCTGAWTISSNASWLSLSTTSGSNNSSITASAISNIHTTNRRSATVTCKQTSSGQTASITIYQYEDGINTSYGNVVAGTITNTTIPASGTSSNYTATAGNGSQVLTYTWSSDGAGAGSETKTISPNVSSISATAGSKGTNVSGVTTVKSQTVTWSGYGSKSASGTMYIYQAANYANSYYDNPVITGYTYGTFAVTGGTLTPSVTYYQTPRYTSGSPGSNITSGGTLGYQMGSYAGFTLNSSSTGSITASRNPNTSTRSATPQVRVTMNGKTSSWYNCTYCTQAANGSVAFTFESGNSNAPLGAFADNSTMYITAVGGWTISHPNWITFSTTSGSGNAQPTFSCTANARNTSQRTGTITLTSTIDGSVVASRTVYQNADHITAENYTSVSNCAIGEPNFEGNFTASGGSAMMDAPATWNAVGTRTWASGATDALSGARSGEAILSFNTNSPSGAFSISGQTVTHRNMTNNATTDKVQIKYTHPQNSGVTKLGGTYSVTNSLISTTRTMSANTSQVSAAGGTITLTCNSTNTYTAGTYAASTALTATAGSLSQTSISGTGQTVTLTIPANPSTSQRYIDVRMDGTNKVTITQPGSAPVGVTATYQDDGFWWSDLSIEANGVNINGGETITYKPNDVIELWFYNYGSSSFNCYVTNSDGNEYEYTTVEPGMEGCIMIDTNDIGPGNFFYDGYICFNSQWA